MKTNHSGIGAKGSIILLLVVIVLGVIGWGIWSRLSEITQKANADVSSASLSGKASDFELPVDWKWYENTKDGFKIAYPVIWGEPDYSKHDGMTGREYTLSFQPGPSYSYKYSSTIPAASRNSLIIIFSSDDFSQQAERGQVRGPYITKQDIDKALSADDFKKAGPATRVIREKDAYVDLIDNVEPGETNVLEVRVANALAPLGVSAVSASYQILDRPDYCPPYKLADANQAWCMTKDTADTLLKILRSLRAI